MTDVKKPDLRNGIEKSSITDTDSKMAGGDDRRDTVMPKTNMHATAPDVGKHLAEGQVTKSN